MPDLAVNKRARYEYDILDTIEVGVQLQGHEVKSVKQKHASIVNAFVHIRGGSAWLTNASIPPYAKASGLDTYEPTRSRRLLIHRRELARLAGKLEQERMTIVPLRMYATRGLVKVEIALARGKRQYEKRAAIKQREDERRMRRAMRG